MATEVKGFGIHVTLVEPNGYSTDWAGASSDHTEPIAAYDGVRAAFRSGLKDDSWGNPEATVPAILQLVANPAPPLRLFLGKLPFSIVKEVYAEKLAIWEQGNDVAVAAHGR